MDNEKKLKYEEPKMSIVIFESEDVITTSGLDYGYPGEDDSLYNE